MLTGTETFMSVVTAVTDPADWYLRSSDWVTEVPPAVWRTLPSAHWWKRAADRNTFHCLNKII